MRILLAGTGIQPIPPPGYGGVERTIAELADALGRAGHEAIVVNEVRHGRMRDEYPFARSLERKLRSFAFDVIHASTPVVARALGRRGRPYVYTSHSRHWFDRHGFTDWWGHYLERGAVRRSVATIALTQALADTMVRDVGPAIQPRLSVVPIGVDGERFRPDWPARTGRVGLGVGVVAPFKRWDLAARALRGTGFTLRIVGPIVDSKYADEVRAQGPEVELLGEISDDALQREYARSDLLIHPSRVELLAGAVLQGLAAGLPILGGEAVGGLVEEGVTGWCPRSPLPPEGLVGFLRQHASRLASDATLRRSMGEQAREAALTRFSWSHVAQQHLEIYRRVVGDASPSRPGSPGP